MCEKFKLLLLKMYLYQKLWWIYSTTFMSSFIGIRLWRGFCMLQPTKTFFQAVLQKEKEQ